MREGIWRIYRAYPTADGDVQRRMLARFVLVGDRIEVLEDHDNLLEDLVPNGRLSDTALSRFVGMIHSPYWDFVHEDDIQAGYHHDLLPKVEG